MNGAQAKAEAKAVASELKKVAGDATGMATAAKKAADATEELETGSRSAANEVRRIAAAEREAAEQAGNLEKSSELAAGQLGNITAQFNDIGMMAMAGQSPFQLAIQQGTQLSQVLGPMGVRGALSALGQGFMSLLSPINLVTIGSIAAGAALFQWLTDVGDEAQSVEDRLDDLSSAVDAYAKAAAAARAPSSELTETYGAMATAAREATKAIAETERAKALSSLNSERAAQSQTFGGFAENTGDIIGSEYEETLSRIRSELGITGLAAVEVAQKLDALGQAAGPAEIAAAALAARQALLDAGVAADQGLAASLAVLAERAAAFAGASEGAKGTLIDLADLIALQADSQRSATEAMYETIAAAQAEAVERNQILIFGRDSELVAQNRLAAEREVLAAMLESKGVAAELATELLASWDAATGFNAEAAGMPGFLSAAAGAAAGIAGNIWNAVTAMAALKAEQATQAFYAFQGDDERGSQRDGVTSAGNWRAQQNLAVANRNASKYRLAQLGSSGSKSKSGGGSSATEAEKERKAVEDLIAKLREELDLEREMDPVKREMIRYREELKGATAAERAEVEKLITQREREKAATESLKWAGEQGGDAMIDALMGAADAGERLIDTLERAVLQALLLGKGPLAGLFGGGLFGGGLGGGLGALIGIPDVGVITFSEGGMVYGEGGPTDDKVSARLSPGEFVVNAAATRRNRRLLEAINSAPGFAQGGMVGGVGMSSGSAFAAGTTINIAPVIDARGSNDPAAVERAAQVGMQKALNEYRRNVLPNDIRRSQSDPSVLRF